MDDLKDIVPSIKLERSDDIEVNNALISNADNSMNSLSQYLMLDKVKRDGDMIQRGEQVNSQPIHVNICI